MATAAALTTPTKQVESPEISASLAPEAPAGSQAIPAYLVKEVLDGLPLYYKGYKEILNGNKTLEEIMGCSSLQAEIIAGLLEFLYKNFDRSKYRIYTNEIGSHINHKNNISHDIAIFDKTVLTADKINKRYTDVPAKIIIEVDVDVEAEKLWEVNYIAKKTDTVFEFGTEKMIWILSAARKVVVAQPGQDWRIVDWNKDIELLDGHFFNIGAYLQSEGITMENKD